MIPRPMATCLLDQPFGVVAHRFAHLAGPLLTVPEPLGAGPLFCKQYRTDAKPVEIRSKWRERETAGGVLS